MSEKTLPPKSAADHLSEFEHWMERAWKGVDTDDPALKYSGSYFLLGVAALKLALAAVKRFWTR